MTTNTRKTGDNNSSALCRLTAISNYDDDLLPRVVTNVPVLRWFLAHGANPNRGILRYSMRQSETDSYAALEAAVYYGDMMAIRMRMLLDAGAKIKDSSPLHVILGACAPGQNSRVGPARPSREFYEGKFLSWYYWRAWI